MTGEIRGAGLFWGIEVVADRAARTPFAPDLHVTRKLMRAAMERGVSLYPSVGMAGERGGDAIMVAPPLVIGDEEVELIANALRYAFDSTYKSLRHA